MLKKKHNMDYAIFSHSCKFVLDGGNIIHIHQLVVGLFPHPHIGDIYETTQDPSSLDFTGDDSNCPWLPMGHRAATVKSYDCLRLHPLCCPGGSSHFLGRRTIAGGLSAFICESKSPCAWFCHAFEKVLMGWPLQIHIIWVHDWIELHELIIRLPAVLHPIVLLWSCRNHWMASSQLVQEVYRFGTQPN